MIMKLSSLLIILSIAVFTSCEPAEVIEQPVQTTYYKGIETIFLTSEEMIIQEDFFFTIEELPYYSNSDTIYLNNENVVRAWSINGTE